MASKKTILTRFDQHLRDQVIDEESLKEALVESTGEISYLRRLANEEPSELNDTRLARARQRHAELLRLADDLDEATEAIDKAAVTWRAYDRHRAYFLVRLKKAMILARYNEQNKTDEALKILDSLQNELDERTKVYEDFLHEAIGRIHKFLGEPELALDHLRQALEIRRRRGNQRHIDQTVEMIEIVKSGNVTN